MKETLKQLKSQLLNYQLTFESYTDDIKKYPEELKLIDKKLSLLRHEGLNKSEIEQISIAKDIIKNYQEFYNSIDDKFGFTIYDNRLYYVPKLKELNLFDKYWKRIGELFSIYDLEMLHSEDTELEQLYNKMKYIRDNKETIPVDTKIELAKEILAEFDNQIDKLDNLQIHIYGKGEQ